MPSFYAANVITNDARSKGLTTATDLTDEVREKAVLALTTTTQAQCRGLLGRRETNERCSLGVVLEGLGFQLMAIRVLLIDTYHNGWVLQMKPEDVEAVSQLLPSRFVDFLVVSNDRLKLSFDEIAKGVKDWTPNWECR